LNGGTFAAERRTRAYLQDTENEFTCGITKRDASGLHRVGRFDLGDAAADRAGRPIMHPESCNQATEHGREDGEIDPSMAWRSQPAINKRRLGRRDPIIKGNRRETAKCPAGHSEHQDALALGWCQPEEHPGQALAEAGKSSVETLCTQEFS